jgi:hypothetical protein
MLSGMFAPLADRTPREDYSVNREPAFFIRVVSPRAAKFMSRFVAI